VKLVGDLSLLPEDLQRLMHSVMKETAENEGPRLNICFSYTARDEICTALVHMLNDILERKLSFKDMDASLLDEYIARGQGLSKECLAPDIILRTSGEARLSDFLLWQSSYSLLYFSDRMWPDFGLWDFLQLLFWYQRHWREYQQLRQRQEHCQRHKEGV
jgi:undecaprenyl diphosphate synthase